MTAAAMNSTRSIAALAVRCALAGTILPSSGCSNSEASCGVPAGFKWSSSGVLVSPISDATHTLVSIKDPTVVSFNGKWNVYASIVNTAVDASGDYNLVYLGFTDWSSAATAPQYYLDKTPGFVGYHAAPELFYFTPQKKWYLVYQSGPPSYSTADAPDQPSTWTAPKNFFSSTPAIVTQNAGSAGLGWIDFWVICDDKSCYLFFENDNGFFFRSQTPIGDFPHGFSAPVVVMQDANPDDLFEASNVYKIKGANRYMAIIEAIGKNGRYFRSWTADALDGTWTPLADTEANPFAGESNVSFSGTKWTHDISHGEMLRDGYDETLTIDTCHLQYLYQGKDPSANEAYNLLPWRIGLLTKTN